MHVVNMPRIIGFIADRVLPEPPLPDTPLTLSDTNLRAPFGAWQFLHEADFDRFPAIGIIIIPRRQCLNAMHKVGQHHPGIDMKRPLSPRHPHRRTQHIHMPHQSIQSPRQQIHRKKIRPARHPIPPIIRYSSSFSSTIHTTIISRSLRQKRFYVSHITYGYGCHVVVSDKTQSHSIPGHNPFPKFAVACSHCNHDRIQPIFRYRQSILL